VIGDAAVMAALDYPRLEAASTAEQARGELVAVLRSGSRPGGNWVSAAAPFLDDPNVAAVVTPSVASLRGMLRQRVAAAVLESRLGGGSRRSSHFPGNVRVVVDYPAQNVVARRDDYLASRDAGIGGEELVAWLAARGRRTVYTPDASIAVAPPPLVRPHLASTFRHGVARGRAARRTRGRSLSVATALSFAPALAAVVGTAFLLSGGALHTPGLVLVLAYVGALLVNAVHAAARFRSVAVGIVEPFAVVASQAAYLAGFARGLTAKRSL
jgi:hypothetical protein